MFIISSVISDEAYQDMAPCRIDNFILLLIHSDKIHGYRNECCIVIHEDIFF